MKNQHLNQWSKWQEFLFFVINLSKYKSLPLNMAVVRFEVGVTIHQKKKKRFEVGVDEVEPQKDGFCYSLDLVFS